MLIFISKGMLRRILLVIMLVLVSCSYLGWWLRPQWSSGELRELTLLIDAGHGGVDGGTSDDQGNLEKDINLAIALKLRDQLKGSGLRLVMTRETDTDLAPFSSGKGGRHRRDLLRRLEKAKENQCLLLVSIHCDSINVASRFGAVAFYNSLSVKSKELALTIQDELNLIQTRQFKAAPGKYLIIGQREIPGVLVEVGFLSNPEEAKALQTEEHQTKLAMAIAKGVLKYCQGLL